MLSSIASQLAGVGGWGRGEVGQGWRVTTKPASAHHRLRQSQSWARAKGVGNAALFSVEPLGSGPQHAYKSFQAPELQGVGGGGRPRSTRKTQLFANHGAGGGECQQFQGERSEHQQRPAAAKQTNKQISKDLMYRGPAARRRLGLISLYAALERPHPEHSRRQTGIREPVQKRQC